ncbi:MAG TPA: SPOR domain-containing protein [Terracidiphilus sp.]|nr:SPOR domain-containing protein [Terracidiphilus sp.]
MRRGFDGEDLEPEEDGQSRELTLGPVMLLALLCGLVLLCGLCFGLGYTAGRRSPMPTAAAPTGAPATQPASTLQKPAAAGVVPSVQPPAVLADLPQQGAGAGSGSGNPLTSYAPTETQTNAVAGQSLVRPALTPGPEAAQSGTAQQGGALQVQPALSPSAGMMVQIAAVTHPEDANVLVNALRRRGFAVTARHEAEDSLIHVQIGPFRTVQEADAMCQRLLTDGYNAVVVP